MSSAKQERLVNLTICLLSSRRFLTKDEIRRAVTNYRDVAPDAFDRTFERDKAELRAKGIPIETGNNDAYFADEIGYRIPRADFELPAVDLTPAEATAVALAASLWQQQTLAEPTRLALAKLRAIGANPDLDRAAALGLAEGGLQLTLPDEVFSAFLKAYTASQRIRFCYRGQLRTLEPWVFTMRHNAWYANGLDVDKNERRSFRLNRVEGTPTLLGAPGAFVVPDGVSARDVAASFEPKGERAVARLAIRDEAAPHVRRRGVLLEDPSPWPDYRLYDVELDLLDAVGEIASAGEDVVVMAPAGLRDDVIEQLRYVAGWEGTHA